MISKPVFFAAIVCTAALAVGVVMYQRSRAEVSALRAQVAAGRPGSPGEAPSLAAAQARPVAAAEPAEPSEPAAGPTLADKLRDASFLSDALRLTLPLMDDTVNQQSDGAVMLAMWAALHMKWADVGVAKNETSTAKLMKDSDANRGKRMCVSGSIIQIAKQRGAPIYAGLLNGFYGAGIAHFFAVGDTGDLVENSETRFCGVATGRYVYGNSGGGTSHAISLVGMFDLPENNPSKRRRVAADEE